MCGTFTKQVPSWDRYNVHSIKEKGKYCYFFLSKFSIPSINCTNKAEGENKWIMIVFVINFLRASLRFYSSGSTARNVLTISSKICDVVWCDHSFQWESRSLNKSKIDFFCCWSYFLMLTYFFVFCYQRWYLTFKISVLSMILFLFGKTWCGSFIWVPHPSWESKLLWKLYCMGTMH